MSQNQSSSSSAAPKASAKATPTSTASADKSGQTFQPVKTGQETASGELLLIEAYAVIWLLAFGLIIMSIRRQRQLDARITQLNADLAKVRKKESE